MPQARRQGETNRNLKAYWIIRDIEDLQVGVNVVGVRKKMYWQVVRINVERECQLRIAHQPVPHKKTDMEQSESWVLGDCSSFTMHFIYSLETFSWPSHIMPAVALRLDIISRN